MNRKINHLPFVLITSFCLGSLASCGEKEFSVGEMKTDFFVNERYKLPIKTKNVYDLKIESSDSSIAYVYGKSLYFKSEGNATIEITCKSQDYQQTFEVQAKEKSDTSNITAYELNQRNGYHSLKSNGKRRVLVLPVSIKDYEYNATEENLSHIKKVFTGGNDGISVHDLYYQSSYEKLDIDFVVPNDWFECNMTPKDIQATVDSSYGVVPLIDKGLEWYFGGYQNTYTKKDFDLDSDGFFDGVFVVYDSPNYTNTTDYKEKYKCYYPENFWALSSTSLRHQEGNVDDPVSKAYCFASYDFMETGDGNKEDSHTYIHETGHLLGLFDYYANRHPKGVTATPIGVIDTMDNDLGDHCPFSKFTMGFTAPKVVKEDILVELNSFTETGDFLLIGPKDYNNTAFDEYFTIDLVTPTGLNAYDYKNGFDGIPGYSRPGIRVMHVDNRALDNLAGNFTDKEEEMKKVPFSNSWGSNVYKETGKNLNQVTLIQKNFDKGISVLSDNKEYLKGLRNGTVDPNDALFKKGDVLEMKEGSKYLELMPSMTNAFDSYQDSNSDNDKFSFTMKVIEIKDGKATISISF